MLLVYTPRLTNRLGYTLGVVFRHLLHIEFCITTDTTLFLAAEGPKLCYSPKRIGDALHIKCSHLLFETSIEDQEPRPELRDGQWLLFPVYGSDLDFPFDLLAATFYMVSRYEEYLPHREDSHGRFAAAESLSMQAGFLTQPVVDQWACLLKQKLMQRWPTMPAGRRAYSFVQTVDIDAAWCYLHKGFFRTAIGAARDLAQRSDPQALARRWRVLLHREADPFDTFDYIIAQRPKGSTLIFFALLADYDHYDKPSSYLNTHTAQLMQHLDDYAKMGIHPSYHSLEHPRQTDIETERLEAILHRPIVRSRYHFLRLRLPESYRILIHAGIEHDYTMGYADAPGFRAGISSPYHFYDLERDLETTLTIHPFCTMDTTLQQYMRLEPDAAIELYADIIGNLRRVDGTFCCTVHNQNLCELFGWQGWRRVYEQMLLLAN